MASTLWNLSTCQEQLEKFKQVLGEVSFMGWARTEISRAIMASCHPRSIEHGMPHARPAQMAGSLHANKERKVAFCHPQWHANWDTAQHSPHFVNSWMFFKGKGVCGFLLVCVWEVLVKLEGNHEIELVGFIWVSFLLSPLNLRTGGKDLLFEGLCSPTPAES